MVVELLGWGLTIPSAQALFSSSPWIGALENQALSSFCLSLGICCLLWSLKAVIATIVRKSDES